MSQSTFFIRARSRHEAMDWGLVLASQEIEATIIKGESGWGLVVAEEDYRRALEVLRSWRRENRGWHLRHKVAGVEFFFDARSLIWALGLAAIYYWTLVRYPALQSAGAMNTQAIAAGEWWRYFTAVTLHADLPHLLANITTGVLLLGLAMSRFGPGVALIAAFGAGVAANWASLQAHGEIHQGLGASGMVMGALGLLATHSFVFWSRYPLATQVAVRALAAGILMLVLMGFAPGTDVVAHVGGFGVGACLGYLLGWIDVSRLNKTSVNVVCIMSLLGCIILTWWLAAARG